MRIVNEDSLNEMAYSRADAIERCANLGKQFIIHFDKIYNESNNNTKQHHAKEMQTWLDDISKIRLTYNNKPLNEKNIYDWFITIGQLISDLFDDEGEAITYEEFVTFLLDYYDKNVIQALQAVNLI